jgi:hypothetical protein
MRRSIGVSLALTLIGQAILVVAAPFTRASGTYVTRLGIALVAPDSERYLVARDSLTDLALIPWTYRAYPVLVRLADALGEVSLVVVLQALLLVAAGAALHRLVDRLAGGLAALVATAALTANPLVAQWVRFVLTETVFYALIVTVVALAVAMRRDPAGRSAPVALAALGALALFLRPNGSLVLMSLLGLIAVSRAPRRAAIAIVAALVVATPLLVALGQQATGMPAEAPFARQLYEGWVIEGPEDVRLDVGMPPADDPSDESNGAALRYVAAHPVAAAGLALARVGVELAQVRPHYPRAANVVVAIGIVGFLALMVAGFGDPRSREVRVPALAIAVPLLLMVGATFAVPEGRFGWSALVAMTPFVGIGADRVVARVRTGTGDRRS